MEGGTGKRKKCLKNAYSKPFDRNLTSPKEEVLCPVLDTAVSRYKPVKFRVKQ